MKKLMFVAVAALSASVFADEGITSDVVGYQSFGDGSWVTQAGAAFSPVSATKWTNTTSVFGNDVVAGDTVMKFSSAVWDLISWAFKGYDATSGESLGWGYAYTDEETWEPASTVVSSFETKQGDTVVFQPADATSGLTVSGQVTDTTKSATWTLAANEWIGDIMNPFPVATTLADLETFAVAGDAVLVFNPTFWDLDSYAFKGTGNGWGVATYDSDTYEAKQYVVTDTTTVVLPAGVGGCYQPADQNGRTWTVTLTK